jgi:hypothetical protein
VGHSSLPLYPYESPCRIAILIDGGFFLTRLLKLMPPHFCTTPKQTADSARTGQDKLSEHVDGIASVFPRPESQDSKLIAA